MSLTMRPWKGSLCNYSSINFRIYLFMWFCQRSVTLHASVLSRIEYLRSLALKSLFLQYFSQFGIRSLKLSLRFSSSSLSLFDVSRSQYSAWLTSLSNSKALSCLSIKDKNSVSFELSQTSTLANFFSILSRSVPILLVYPDTFCSVCFILQ